MTASKIRFAKRTATVTVVSLTIAIIILMSDGLRSAFAGPGHRMGAATAVFFLIMSIVGFSSAVVTFVLFLMGWVDPISKPVYLSRIRLAFFGALGVNATTLCWNLLMYIIDYEYIMENSAVFLAFSFVFAVLFGLAALILYLSGWGENKRSSTSVPPPLGRHNDGGHEATTRSVNDRRTIEKPGFVGRLSRIYLGIAKFVAWATIPIALIFVIFSYVGLSHQGDGAYFALVGPLGAIYIILIGFGVAGMLAVIGSVLNAIVRRKQ